MRSLLAPRSIPHRTPAERVEAICALRRLRLTSLGDRRAALDAALDRLGGAAARGARQALAARAARAGQPLRALASRRARPRRRQEAGADPQARPPGDRRPPRPGEHAIATASRCVSPAGSSFTLPSTTTRDSPTPRFWPTSALRPRSASSAARCAFFASHGIRVERVMTDNGSAYRSRRCMRSPAASSACVTCAPSPTGRGPTARPSASSRRCSRDWAYGRLYGNKRRAHCEPSPLWLKRYNFERPHGSLGHRPPGSRLTNVAGIYS